MIRHPSAVWCFDLQREEKVPTRFLPKFCILCKKVRQLMMTSQHLIDRSIPSALAHCAITGSAQLSIIRLLLSSARDWLAGAAGADRHLPEQCVHQQRRSEAPPTSLQRTAAPTPANTAPLRKYTPSLQYCAAVCSTVKYCVVGEMIHCLTFSGFCV